MKRVEVFSQEELLLQTLTDLIVATGAQADTGYNNIIAESFAELIKERMFKLAEAERSWLSSGGLLDRSYRDAERRLQARLAPYETPFDCKRYRETLCEELKPLAKEVAALQRCLWEARREGKSPYQVPIEIGEQVTFQIFAVGRAADGKTESLVAVPTSQQCALDFQQVREVCSVEGEWFPFQLTYRDSDIGELLFVCDQDGAICLYTHNLPGAILKRVHAILKAIGSQASCTARRLPTTFGTHQTDNVTFLKGIRWG